MNSNSNYLQHLFKATTLVFMFLSVNLHAQNEQIKGANSLHAHFRGKTKPLSELAPMPGTPRNRRDLKKLNKPDFTPPNFINYRRQPKVNLDALPIGMDPIRQDGIQRGASILVEPRLVFDGIQENQADAGVPDTNGDVGPDHYIQIVNASWFQVFSKDGTPLTTPTSANTIWSQINQQSFSDPVISYDEDAQRWLITDLANINVVLYGVSETSDPMGAWNLYTLNTPGFADYPKYGIWPTAYIFTINEGQGTYPVYALNRQQMLNGESTIDVQRVEIPGLNGGFPTATPMDWNSPTAPPNNDVFVVRLNDDAWGNGNATDQLEVWTININWAMPSNTTASSTILGTAPYDSDGCSVSGGGFACIPQPGTSQGIDGIMTIIMNNVAYWNYGTHESAVLTFSVDAGNDVAGIRWAELRRLPGGDWTLFQEGTYAPDDGDHRFIGGISINGNGDIALAYSVSSENTYPSLRFTGRRSSDPLGEMTVDEFEFATGAGVRSLDRYGDYARMTVDPSDGSFWFTSEYVLADGSYSTKIVNFALTRDTLDIGPVNLLSPQNGPLLSNTEPVAIEVKNFGLEPATNITVGYIFENGSAVIEPASIDTLFPDSIYMHTFVPTVDMSTIGDYSFKVFSSFALDQNIQNDTLRRTRSHLPRFDAGVTNILGLDEVSCDSIIEVMITFTNFGTEPLTSLNLNYSLNGGTIQMIDWEGNLNSGESASISISLSNLISGLNTITVSTQNPNGLSDEIPGNDSYSRDFQVILNGFSVNLEISLDFFPDETTWQLEDENGNILFSGGPYAGQFGQTILEEWCLAEGECYVFSIFDSYGDGLENPFGPDGNYSIQDVDGNVLASILQTNFGFEEQNEFCAQTPCNLVVEFDVTPEQSDMPNSGAILASVTSGVAPFSYSLDGGQTNQNDPLFTNLGAADYTVLVTDANGCTSEQTVTVPLFVSSNELAFECIIKAYPNPSSNGVFWLEVKGLSTSGKDLDIQIVDVTGKAVSYQTINEMDGYYKGLVSLVRYPAGVYFIRFKSKDINQMVRIIRQ